MVDTLELIAQARKHLHKDPGLSAFIVRDCPEAKELGMTDLLWSLTQYGAHRNDVKPILDKLEEYTLAQEKGE